MKKFIAVFAAMMLALTVTACGAVSIDGESSKGKDTDTAQSDSIGFSISTLNNPFFVTLSDGAKAEAEAASKKLIVLDAGDDPAKQVNDIEDLISKGVRVLIINPVDSDAVAPIANDAMKQGIKVISVDSVINRVEVDSQIASNNTDGGKKAGQYILDKLGKDAVVAEIEGISGNSTTIQRGEGFHSIADKELNVVTKQTANFNRSEGLSVMENILQANSDLKAVFAHNDEMALGAIEAIGDKDILVVGFDATKDALQAIKDGKMAATIEQKPKLMGETAVKTAVSLLAGESVEPVIPIEVELITK